ncbi:MAG: hypothetical protein L0Y58_17675 [Verrucomicrobia subdivision 3 bacterium]|nr:hypothetical protein [Limisphaerales bacterium]
MKTLPILLPLVALVALSTGCKSVSLHQYENHRSTTKWENYDEAEEAFNKIKPHETKVSELKDLGFDPHATPNIKILNYLDIMQRFVPNASITMEHLHPDVRACIESKEAALGYELDLDIVRRKRFGNLALDMTGFKKKTQVFGWNYKALLLIKDGTVVYKLRSGQPNVDRIERKNKPLGPLQEIDGLISKIPGF